MNELILMFLLNLLASFLGALIALWFNRKWKQETTKEIEKTKKSIQQTIRKAVKKVTGNE